ncbi:hypothetical protein C2G38_919936 [Gigaspora rosea]|uniref:Transmembrane protein n=1 Tax=Gigaspora rosea TaxID=44941 RepID=A0A397TZX4_9GLOM|nr:hypothetical protein C2G38_919936 [Gigaspora rosea]
MLFTNYKAIQKQAIKKRIEDQVLASSIQGIHLFVFRIMRTFVIHQDFRLLLFISYLNILNICIYV